MSKQHNGERRRQIIDRTRQLILMRETGPKSRAWHAARVRMIWRLHDELRAAEAAETPPDDDLDTAESAC
jgi:hypothetical protein